MARSKTSYTKSSASPLSNSSTSLVNNRSDDTEKAASAIARLRSQRDYDSLQIINYEIHDHEIVMRRILAEIQEVGSCSRISVVELRNEVLWCRQTQEKLSEIDAGDNEIAMLLKENIKRTLAGLVKEGCDAAKSQSADVYENGE